MAESTPQTPEAAMTDQTHQDEATITAVWKSLMDQGRAHLGQRQVELSLQSFTSALHLCDAHPHLANHKYRVLGDLGWVNRSSGRYVKALENLQEALALADAMPGPPTKARVHIAGEVGTVYRQMDRLEEAKEAFADQYATAMRLGIEAAMCRAVGNMGIVNYQQASRLRETDEHGAKQLVKLAIRQLEEGLHVAMAMRATRYREAMTWESILHGRLSLCYTALASMDGDEDMLDKAAEVSSKAVDCAMHLSGSILPISEFFYGRVLLLQGRPELALQQFNPKPTTPSLDLGVTTPAMAMCKEPSREHRGYLREMIDAGADLTILDPDGYTALDHAVFSGDTEAEAMVVEGLQNQHLFDESMRTEARLRKGYREILQEKLRPVLYQRDEDCMKKLRRVYAETLAGDAEASHLFDRLKFMRFVDFKDFGKLPRSSDGLVCSFDLRSDDLDFLIFFSYRWINQDKTLNTPDDTSRTQYRRMLDAAEQFLVQNPLIDAEKLCVWMDFACVDQDNPGTGVSALPIIITQCDAVISLVDDMYYERAWCCVEAMMIAQLVNSSGSVLHQWYEHMPDDANGWILKKARGVPITMKDKKLTYEHDRPKVTFLERQSRFVGQVSL